MPHGRSYILKDKTSKQPAGGGRTAPRRTAGGGRGEQRQTEDGEEVKSENNASNKGNAGKKRCEGMSLLLRPECRIPTNP